VPRVSGVAMASDVVTATVEDNLELLGSLGVPPVGITVSLERRVDEVEAGENWEPIVVWLEDVVLSSDCHSGH
jgi:hypothetical protein